MTPRPRLRRALTAHLLERGELLRLKALDIPNWWHNRPLVRDLDLPAGATVADLLELLSKRQGREIIVSLVPRSAICAQTGRDDARAAWLRFEDYDVLLIDEEVHFSTRDHDVVHELSHMLLDTKCALLANRLHGFNDVSQERIITMKPAVRGRGNWLDEEERKTELLATMIRRELVPSETSEPFTGTALLDARLKLMLGCDTETNNS